MYKILAINPFLEKGLSFSSFPSVFDPNYSPVLPKGVTHKLKVLTERYSVELRSYYGMTETCLALSAFLEFLKTIKFSELPPHRKEETKMAIYRSVMGSILDKELSSRALRSSETMVDLKESINLVQKSIPVTTDGYTLGLRLELACGSFILTAGAFFSISKSNSTSSNTLVIKQGMGANVRTVKGEELYSVLKIFKFPINKDGAIRKLVLNELQLLHKFRASSVPIKDLVFCLGNRVSLDRHFPGKSLGVWTYYKLYLCMPRMQGTLIEVLCGNIPGIDKRHYPIIVRKLLFIIADIHQRHVLHRDIKLDNIFVNKNRDEIDVFMGDYGLAHDMDEEGHHGGSTDYIAPEVVLRYFSKKEFKQVTGCFSTFLKEMNILRAKSSKLSMDPSLNFTWTVDTWSLGVTILKMLDPMLALENPYIKTKLKRNFNPTWAKNILKISKPKKREGLLDLAYQLMFRGITIEEALRHESVSI